MNTKKAFPYLVLIVLAVVVLVVKRCNPQDTNPRKKQQTTTTAANDYGTRGLNRNPAHVNYSKHARCRMGCRHIDEKEVMEILHDGKVNYKKSELNAAECKKRYAVEGYSHDRQHLRIIFAPCNDEITVVTCIDLDNEFDCDCK